jgi:two-component system, OmpR family, phosphate regulon response regulator PhoB
MSGSEPITTRRVLVVDDEHGLRVAVHRALETEGYRVEEAANGADAITAARACPPDAVILDLGLPDMSGMDVLAELRRIGTMPVLVLSGRAGEADRVAALELGADDYVVKPFLARELAARVRALLRRSGMSTGASKMAFGALVIDTDAREILVDGTVVDLTTKEFDLLAYLAAAPRRVVSREELLRSVWDSSAEWQDADTVTEHVRRVRLKIETAGSTGWITTIRGVGYRFEPGAA